jgi:anti-sigma B factor antagonist
MRCRHPPPRESGIPEVIITVDDIKHNVRRIRLDGRLDMAGAKAVEAEYNAILSADPNVIVDLEKVSFIASVGIRLLMTGCKMQMRMGGRLVLINPDEIARNILKSTGIDQLMPVCDSLDAALEMFA